jgi:hypothetical protein
MNLGVGDSQAFSLEPGMILSIACIAQKGVEENIFFFQNQDFLFSLHSSFVL